MERLKKKHFGQLFQLSLLVLLTVLSTTVGSVFLLVGFFSDHWEMMEYNTTRLGEMKLWKNLTEYIDPQVPEFDRRVARLTPTTKKPHQYDVVRSPVSHVSQPSMRVVSSTYIRTPVLPNFDARQRKTKRAIVPRAIFLVPVRGGMLKYCVDVDDIALAALQSTGLYQEPCVYYLKASNDEEVDMSMRPSHYVQREHASMRIHNLALSCSLVSTIVLCTAALLGAFGLTRRQLSAVLITGVMYMLAAVFGIFALCMMYFKRRTPRDFILHNDIIPKDSPYISTRVFTVGASLDISITGVIVTSVAALCWMLLSKMMRYNPIYMVY